MWEGGDGAVSEGMGAWRDDEGVISSDEEPLAEVSRRLSTIAKRKCRAGGASPSPTTTTTTTFEISPTKTIALPHTPRRRTSSHSVTSPSSSSDVDDTPAVPPGMPDYATLPIADLQKQVTRYGFRVSKERSVLVDQLTQVWIATHHQAAVKKKVAVKKAPTRGRQKKAVVQKEVSQEEAEIESLGERLRTMLVSEEEMYLKILRYEVSSSFRACCTSS